MIMRPRGKEREILPEKVIITLKENQNFRCCSNRFCEKALCIGSYVLTILRVVAATKKTGITEK